MDHLTWIRLQQPQEQRRPFLPICAVFVCVSDTVVFLLVFGIFTVCTDFGACSNTQGGCTNTGLNVNSGEEKCLVPFRDQTPVSVVPGFSV